MLQAYAIQTANSAQVLLSDLSVSHLVVALATGAVSIAGTLALAVGKGWVEVKKQEWAVRSHERRQQQKERLSELDKLLIDLRDDFFHLFRTSVVELWRDPDFNKLSAWIGKHKHRYPPNIKQAMEDIPTLISEIVRINERKQAGAASDSAPLERELDERWKVLEARANKVRRKLYGRH
ncbi:hypothetical protein [Thioalkalivibrio sp.]|uniref:hypothetical protein n=1 Tax=Thioalkalivibrio sp. TaxID=2093813 RepID=UPI003565B437